MVYFGCFHAQVLLTQGHKERDEPKPEFLSCSVEAVNTQQTQ